MEKKLVGVNNTNIYQGQNKKGEERTTTRLILTAEQVSDLSAALGEAAGLEEIELTVFTDMRTTNDGRREFPASFLIVSERYNPDAKGPVRAKNAAGKGSKAQAIKEL